MRRRVDTCGGLCLLELHQQIKHDVPTQWRRLYCVQAVSRRSQRVKYLSSNYVACGPKSLVDARRQGSPDLRHDE